MITHTDSELYDNLSIYQNNCSLIGSQNHTAVVKMPCWVQLNYVLLHLNKIVRPTSAKLSLESRYDSATY